MVTLIHSAEHEAILENLDDRCAITTASAIAHRLRRQRLIDSADVDDMVGDLVLSAMERWPRYESKRAGAATFLSVVMNRAAISLLRSRRSPKRGYGRCVSLEDSNNDADSAGNAGAIASDSDRAALRIDLDDARQRLPDHLRAYCTLFETESKTEVARLLNVPRHFVEARAREIRDHFEAAGLDEYHPAVNRASVA